MPHPRREPAAGGGVIIFGLKAWFDNGSRAMTLGTILLIILILVLLGVIPTWPYSSGWGYGPSGIVGVILVIVLILLLLGRI
jgi:hypothetical protein